MSLAPFVAQATTDDQHGILTSIIIWLFIGLIAGFLGGKLVTNTGEGLIRNIILGLIGSFVGGFIFSLIGIRAGGPTGSVIVATIGAVIVLVIYHKLIAAVPSGVGARVVSSMNLS